MESILFLNYPQEDIDGIEGIVREGDVFTALLIGDLYRIFHYLNPAHGMRFFALLDRNIYTRITALIDEPSCDRTNLDDLRLAAAILAFLQIADVTFDYNSSLYELGWTTSGVNAVSALKRFNILDNSDPQLFIDFALGKTDKIDPERLAITTPRSSLPHAAEYERRLNDFRINYIFSLKIAQIADSEGDGLSKLFKFFDWMYSDFILGSPATLFALRYFSPNRIRRMLKGRSKRDLENAAWDMTLVQNWRRHALEGLDNSQPYLLVTRDRAVTDMGRRITAESNDEMLQSLREMWGTRRGDAQKIFDEYTALMQRAASPNVTERKLPKYEAHLELMAELERDVLAG